MFEKFFKVWFRPVRQIVVILLGAIALIALALRGFGGTPGPGLEILLDTWAACVNFLLGWALPPIAEFIEAVARSFGFAWDLRLGDHWRDVFTLLFLYFIRDASHFFELGLYKNSVLSFLAGLILATTAALGSGLASLEAGDVVQNLLVGASAILGFLAYAIVMAFGGALWNRIAVAERDRKPGQPLVVPPFWTFFRQRAMMGVYRAAVGALVLTAGLLVTSAQVSAVVWLIVLWIMLALWWLRRGWQQAAAVASRKEKTFSAALVSTGNVNLGLEMLGAVAVALVGLWLNP